MIAENNYSLDCHMNLSGAFMDTLVIRGRPGFDQIFLDINNYDLEGAGVRYFWSEFSLFNFIEGYDLKPEVTLKYCGVTVDGGVSMLVNEITSNPGSKSSVRVLFQIEFDSKRFLDTSSQAYAKCYSELMDNIVIPFYMPQGKIVNSVYTAVRDELDKLCKRLYHLIQFEFVRLELLDISPEAVEFIGQYTTNTIKHFYCD
jgi:hypothetical protein